MYKKELTLLGTNDFKRLLFSFPNLSDEERTEVIGTEITYLHLYFGVVPKNMTISLLAKIARFKEFEIEEHSAFPLYPIVQSSWDGARLANWLISAGKVKESKRADITEKLTGEHFLHGYVKDILKKEDLELIYVSLADKWAFIFSSISYLLEESEELKSAICTLFNIDQKRLPIDRDIGRLLKKNYTLKRQTPRHYRELEPADVCASAEKAFRQEYLSKDSVALAFVNYIKGIVGANRDTYFAGYTYLGQGSGVGKSRLLAESWEYDGTALFILRLNCRRRGDRQGYPYTGNETGLLVERILRIRSQEQMAALLRGLLHLVFEEALDDSNYLKDPDHLSLSIEDLGITDDEIAEKSFDSDEIDGTGFETISDRINGMKLKRGSQEKKVIPIVAFDDAAVLITNEFLMDYNIDSNILLGTTEIRMDPSMIFKGIEEMNTFRLIRRVLHTDKDRLWGCPFVFASTNTGSMNFAPP
jgi:hypothetical protein